MNKFKIGNVIKTKYNNIEIVTKADDDYTSTVSFSYSNSSAGHKTKDTFDNVECSCVDLCGHSDLNCKKCKGTGRVKQIRYGSNSAELLGDTVKDYILTRLTKNFNF